MACRSSIRIGVLLIAAVVLCGCAGKRVRIVEPKFHASRQIARAAEARSLMRSVKPAVAHVFDVGVGLCVLIADPGKRYVVYDTGKQNSTACSEAVRGVVGSRAIDLMILSHVDADHIGGVAKILGNHRVGTIVWTGDQRDTDTWGATNSAIKAARSGGSLVYSFQSWDEFEPGVYFEVGDLIVTLVAGWGKSPWPLELSERRNAISVVAHVTYGASTLLLTGDTIGRNRNADNAAWTCESAEEFMVANADVVPIQADVLTAPHHGGNNGSSSCFIEAVAPTAVVFSAGHDHEHPRALTASRYLELGLTPDALLRTDRGDNEGHAEWSDGLVAPCGDVVGDDSVTITLSGTGPSEAAYDNADTCEEL